MEEGPFLLLPWVYVRVNAGALTYTVKDVTEDTHNMHLREIWGPSQFCSLLGCNGEIAQLISAPQSGGGEDRTYHGGVLQRLSEKDRGLHPTPARHWQAWEASQVILIFS